ncbi:hypothetical protein H6P81_017432 [Aristolochia fimbriata]|uniref:Uncharacterized protein n=1 Tax=Aristolochia fimbriata TaxID=158543 RepID=A0AAV7DYH9_ARIFI|nr:hypothetical protein H6P81_017432 [Aristolochia fimbriata]
MSTLVSRFKWWPERRTEMEAVTEPPKDPLIEIEDLDRELLKDIKVGFRPLFYRNADTSIYVIPRIIYNVKPQQYRVRSTYFNLGWNFEATYPRQNLHDLHISAHVQSILLRNPDRCFEDFLLAMNAMKERIRVSHLVRIRVDFKCLSVLVMSCCQILDCLLLYYDGKLVPQVDQVCCAGLQDLWIDMLLVDNQVPFFALQKLYDMVIGLNSQYPSLVELCLHFFDQFLEFRSGKTPLMESGAVLHLLHLVHTHLLPTNSPHEPPTALRLGLRLFFNKIKSTVIRSRPPPPPQLPNTRESARVITIQPIPCARRLQDAGIKLRKKESSGFSNITFHRTTLEIPHLRIDNNTETLLRTLVAWEQCHLDAGAYFTSLAIFMDYIINTAEDVEILNGHGIIEQTLGSDEQVASVFNGLGTNIVFIGDENDFLPHLCWDLNRFCRKRFNIWWAKLLTDYFGNPWTILSVIAAIFLLILTAVQTFFSVFGYFRPPN